MQDDLVKLCPDCGSEFQTWVERCLDCGATLVHAMPSPEAIHPGRNKTSAADDSAVDDEPAVPSDSLLLRTADVAWIRRLSEDLDDAGIRHWTTPPSWRRDPGLYVLPSDEEAAVRIDRARYAIEVPEVAADETRPRSPVRLRRDPSSDDLDVKLCPSCGAEYQLWVEKCADCGVPLVHPWDLESARQKQTSQEPVAASMSSADSTDPGACPACGETLQEGVLECPGCGLILAQPDVCPNCGAELESYVSSCRTCGLELFGTVEG